MDTQNRTNALFPRVATGNQNNAVLQANAQMSAAFGNRVNNNNSSNNPQNLFNLIQQILNQLWNRPANPSAPDIRAVYGAPVPNPTPTPPDNRAIYGAPVPNPNPNLPIDSGWARPVYVMPVIDQPVDLNGGDALPVYGGPNIPKDLVLPKV